MADTLTTPAATSAGHAATPTINIDLLNDLASTAALKSLLKDNRGAIFTIAKEVAAFTNQPISAAAAANASAALTLSLDNTWDIPNTPLAFSLAASATGKITISPTSTSIDTVATIGSGKTTSVTAITPAGKVYVNIDLAVSITATGQAAGNINGIGISGQVSDGKTATLSLSQPVDATLNTVDAIKLAFSQIVFPLDPTAISTMQTGSLSRVVFDATFNAQVGVTYGLGNHIFSAPGVASALASAEKVVSITPPSIAINTGVKGWVNYLHTDQFALIIDKSADTTATIYLTRALESDVKVGAGINAYVSIKNVSVAIDNTALQSVVKTITKSESLATAVVNAASAPLNNLTTSVNAKLTSWANELTAGGVGLNITLDKNTKGNALFVFEADLTNPNLTNAGWASLISGDILQALNNQGLTLQPGSGISENLKRSATIHFQFFNLFNYISINDFFSNATAQLGPDGTIRLQAYIGDEASTNAAILKKQSTSLMCIYFSVGATEDPTGAVTHTDVDLRIELSETNNNGKGASYVDTLTLIPAPVPAAITTAKQALGTFLGGKPTGKVMLIYDVKASAYSKLTFSPYINGKPGPLPHAADASNWQAFHDASVNLPPKLNFVAPVAFGDWVRYNQAAIDQPGSTIDPDRRHTGAPASGITVLADNDTRLLVSYFLRASQGFMNLCEDLTSLAQQSASTNDLAHYNDLLGFITQISTQDISLPYAIPTAGALLAQLSAGGTAFATNIKQTTDPTNASMTCTVTLT